MKSDIRELTWDVVKWRESVYPNAHPKVMLDKLIDELEELKEKPCDGHELADIMIIFLDYCNEVGVDIVKAVHYKMEINEEREWQIDEQGKLQHRRTSESGFGDEMAYCKHCQDPIPGGTPMECGHPDPVNCPRFGPNRFGYKPGSGRSSDS